MKPNEYIKAALRTEPKKYLFKKTGDITPRIEHAVIGLATEAGEIMDDIKRSKFYAQKLDKTHMIEEAGDIMWYLALLCDSLGTSFEEVWDKNIRKLKRRYPKKFSEKLAIGRNINIERTELEK